jgi:hypothetical protein
MNYFFYFIKHFFRKLRKQTPSLTSVPISLFSCPEGIKFFHQQTELTKNVGLNFSWNTDGVWKDCSTFKQQIHEWSASRLVLEKFSLPLPGNSILFTLKTARDCRFHCRIEAFFPSPVQLAKVTLMLPPDYKNWISGIHEGAFPVVKNWLKVGVPDTSVKIIGAYSESREELFPVLFSFKDALHSLENSDAPTQARILGAEYSCLSSSPFVMEGEIFFFTNKEKFSAELKRIREAKYNPE